MSATTASFDLNAPVSALAREDYVQLFEHETVEQALARLRDGQFEDRIIYFYVTDRAGTLKGVVPARRLLLAQQASLIRDIMNERVVSVSDRATVREAMQMIARRRLLALPVVDQQGRMQGVIDVGYYAQDALNYERHEAAESLFQLVGVHVEQSGLGTVLDAFRRRFLWLPVNIASGLVAAFITGAFDEVLRELVLLAFFIPVVLAVPESVSMQSVTLGLHRIHLAEWGLAVGSWGPWRESRVGLLLGLASGLVVGVLGAAWLGAPEVGLVVAATIAIGSTIAALLGLLIPHMVHRWKLDPKVAAGPAVLALTDLQTLAVYFVLASWLVFGW